MITIFNGRSRSIGESKQEIWAKVNVSLREHIRLFRAGRDLNAFAVFMVLALHANEDGWAWPSTELLMQETSLVDEEAISRCIKHLRSVSIDGVPIFHHYRVKEKGQWGRSYYHIFPTAGGEDKLPHPFLRRWDPKPPPPKPGVENKHEPPPAKPGLAKPGMAKGGDSEEEPSLEEEPDLKEAVSSKPKQPHQPPNGRFKSTGAVPASEDPEHPREEEGAKKQRNPSELERRLLQVVPGIRMPRNCIDILDRKVRTSEGETYSPNEAYRISPIFRDWLNESLIPYFQTLGKEGPKAIKHLVNLIRTSYDSGRDNYFEYRVGRERALAQEKIQDRHEQEELEALERRGASGRTGG